MSSKLQPIRGTHDILPDEFERFRSVVNTARDLAHLYGFREMITPVFEKTEVFARSMGETSDVVSKEMFSFETRGGEGVTLRPEFTAGIVRAFISNGMQQNLPLKLFTTGQAFRYERPQKGRQRQFHQVNFEWLGDDSWYADVETITLAGHLLYSLSGNKGCTLLVNSLGDKKSREQYRKALVKYLTPHAESLSEDSKRRLAQNPLRILDSKDKKDREIIADAPVMTDYLSAGSKERFDRVCEALRNKDVPFFQEVKVDASLVRGLDYYNGIVFEFVANTGELGAQNTVLAGGRYDGLVEQMGGKSTPAIGFAAGVERLLLLHGKELEQKEIKIMIVPDEGVDPSYAIALSVGIRIKLSEIVDTDNVKQALSVQAKWQGSMKKRMEKADKQGATHVVTIALGDKEEDITVRNMKAREDKSWVWDDFADKKKLKEIFGL